jgi:hypothetical protein
MDGCEEDEQPAFRGRRINTYYVTYFTKWTDGGDCTVIRFTQCGETGFVRGSTVSV